MKKEYSLKKITNKIYCVTADKYTLGMMFLRSQEFYESPNKKFRGNHFKIFDYMDWYAKTHAGIFSYCDDWIGFNIPGHVVFDCFPNDINERTKYDKIILDVCTTSNIYPGDNVYLIGVRDDDDGSTLKHEIAHALYMIDPEYKKEVSKLLKNLNKTTKDYFIDILRDYGYTKSVFADEINAYMSTGHFDIFPKVSSYETEPFKKLFNKHYKIAKIS